jgi:hypothetical protein
MRVLSLVLALSSAALCAACSGIFPAPFPSEPAPASPVAGPRPAFLALAPLRWTRDGQTVVELSSDGVLADQGRLVGRLRADGSFTAADKRRSLVMSPAGLVHVAPGFDIQIADDGTAVSRVHGQPEEATTLEQVARPRGGRPGLKIEGLSPALRRTSMWILMIPDLLHLLEEAGQ